MNQRPLVWMPFRALDRAVAWGCYWLIVVYQRFISPRKGFQCACVAYANEPSCSDVARDAFRRLGATQAVPAMIRQFRHCRAAYRAGPRTLLQDAEAHLTKIGAVGVTTSVMCCPFTCDPDDTPTKTEPEKPLRLLDHGPPADDVREGTRELV